MLTKTSMRYNPNRFFPAYIHTKVNVVSRFKFHSNYTDDKNLQIDAKFKDKLKSDFTIGSNSFLSSFIKIDFYYGFFFCISFIIFILTIIYIMFQMYVLISSIPFNLVRINPNLCFFSFRNIGNSSNFNVNKELEINQEIKLINQLWSNRKTKIIDEQFCDTTNSSQCVIDDGECNDKNILLQPKHSYINTALRNQRNNPTHVSSPYNSQRNMERLRKMEDELGSTKKFNRLKTEYEYHPDF